MSRAAKPPPTPLPAQPPSSLALIDADLAESGLARYELAPPSWRAPWLGRSQGDSAVPQFYPTAKGQDEDILSEGNVKNGFAGKNVVQVSCSRPRGRATCVRAKRGARRWNELTRASSFID